jgi:antitoxin (DNA-binding transcriptional repressor) of toxin-antitoxin stability system
MKTAKIGSFEAKTHFSQLLQEVEKGKSFDILRRGKPVAHLRTIASVANPEKGRAALDYFCGLRSSLVISKIEILNWIKEGRH